MKIIGCGARNRGDDQAGLIVAERMRELGFEAEAYTGDPLRLLDSWSADDDVILVDAVQTGAPAGTIHIWDGDIPRSAESAVSSHGFDISKALELARALHRLPASLRVYGIEGLNFSQTQGLSPEVLGAIDTAIRQFGHLSSHSVE
ncbi:MAG TPA: hydrogenase maturation protease [Terriglobales bacterium]|nr:hydrogenase maturation protease [Terriglobales bacterium]